MGISHAELIARWDATPWSDERTIWRAYHELFPIDQPFYRTAILIEKMLNMVARDKVDWRDYCPGEYYKSIHTQKNQTHKERAAMARMRAAALKKAKERDGR